MSVENLWPLSLSAEHWPPQEGPAWERGGGNGDGRGKERDEEGLMGKGEREKVRGNEERE